MELNKQLIIFSGLLFSLIISISFNSFAQEDIFGIQRKVKSRKSDSDIGNAVRNAIGNFSFELSTGAGYQEHRLTFSSEMPENYPIVNQETNQVPELSNTDTIQFRNSNFAYPVNFGVRLNLFNMLSVGAGYGREWGSIGTLTGEGNTFSFEEERYTYDKFYGTVGLILWDANRRSSYLRWRYRKYDENNFYMQSELKQRARQEYPWRFILEGEFGSMTLQKSLDPKLTAGSGYYGVGLRIERDLSEYAKVFIKPAVEIRPYDYTMPDPLEIQEINQRVYNLQVGVSMSLPGEKRCKVSGCKVVMKHIHNGVEYRGSSIWKRQNRKVGQWYGN
jgi:hypothetical protein